MILKEIKSNKMSLGKRTFVGIRHRLEIDRPIGEYIPFGAPDGRIGNTLVEHKSRVKPGLQENQKSWHDWFEKGQITPSVIICFTDYTGKEHYFKNHNDFKIAREDERKRIFSLLGRSVGKKYGHTNGLIYGLKNVESGQLASLRTKEHQRSAGLKGGRAGGGRGARIQIEKGIGIFALGYKPPGRPKKNKS
ncbi:MAG: hypothetical protein OK457_07825 [Thaumarchaeota archaeon]|nr:hypothetical protein [Nitrososphaerota archaeon]